MNYTDVSSDNKENPQTPSRLNKRKSYSILTPVSNVSYSPNMKTLTQTKSDKERIISESTGLVKFALSSNSSPIRSTNSTNPSSPRKLGLPVYIPISDKNEENSPIKSDSNNGPNYLELEQQLLQQYQDKQKELLHHEKQVQVIKFELLELSTKLENCKREEKIQQLKNDNLANNADIYKQVHLQTNQQLNQIRIVKSPPTSPTKYNESKFPSIDTLKKKASFIVDKNLSANFKNEIESVSRMFNSNININNTKGLSPIMPTPNELSHKTSKFFNEVLENLSPKKTNENFNKLNDSFNNTINSISKNILAKSFISKESSEEDLINSSFNFDNLSFDNSHHVDHLNVIYENSDVSEQSDIVDIDDYNSSFEE
ncbi:uncharacterized protein RJT21DRAFT_12815 [Scheffersomyces amazonensis]|uniref:uncharacterized protein n=1 Tax=Scheffersomyces amazonensis TaxID=1078765 RepID=UPI00315DBA59